MNINGHKIKTINYHNVKLISTF